MSLFKDFKKNYDKTKETVMSLEDYLEACKDDHMMYANAAERILLAIGKPEIVDTSKDPKLSRIFSNRLVSVYPAFKDFYGMEDTIETIVGYFKHSSQGLEEKKQILYLLGPVGGGKSSLAEKLKSLMEDIPFYGLAIETDDGLEISPVFESPLGLFSPEVYAKRLLDEYNIPERYITGLMSPWAVKRLREVLDGGVEKFKVVRLMPSKLNQIGIAKTEPGDENNQDISSLVGKVDIRRLNKFSQDDPDCYSFSGSLCRANQGIMEFVEMFKAPIKILHPLLTATQEGNYNGTEALSSIPFQGIILAHSNEAEWQTFKNNKANEAFIDRVSIVKVPYCLRVTDEVKIYEKLLRNSSLHNAVCAPKTLEMMAQFAVLSRLKEPENSSIHSKMRIYDGENLKDTDPNAKSIHEYKEYAGVDEGMTGLSTRFAFKTLSRVFNFDSTEIAANPVHLLRILEDRIEKAQFGEELESKYKEFINASLKQKYAEFIGKEIQIAYLESYSDYGQNLFDRYIEFADHWLEDKDFRDPDTGEMFDKGALNKELEKIEKPAGIVNPKEFRGEVVNFSLRVRANNKGRNPKWTSYEKLRVVIEKKLFATTESLLPVIAFGPKKSEEDERKHGEFVDRMIEQGYTEKQIELLVSWYIRVRKSE
ncbi:hypothetical protein LCGC14_0921430 [marine sediment metagenome]|uniref:PrkA AAA domain-containing protein n=1 Tax=marine sediment metagenome TaxID=412755 RepID=A0A0F9RXE9_9ZZZZ